MLGKHRPRICSRQIDVEILERTVAGHEVAIMVRRTEQLPHRLDLFIVAPLLRLIITAPLHCYACLKREISAKGKFALESGSEHLCAWSVVSFSYAAHSVIRRFTGLPERIGIPQQSKESFRHKIELCGPKTVVPVS